MKFLLYAALFALSVSMGGCGMRSSGFPSKNAPAKDEPAYVRGGAADDLDEGSEAPDAPLDVIDYGSIETLRSAGVIEIYQNDDGSIGAILGTFTDVPVNSEADAARVLTLAQSLFGNQFSADVSHITVQALNKGEPEEERFYKCDALVNGVPVWGSQITLVTNGDGVVQELFSKYDARIEAVDTIPAVTAETAENSAVQALISSDKISDAWDAMVKYYGSGRGELEAAFLSTLTTETKLTVYATDSKKAPFLAWAVGVVYRGSIFPYIHYMNGTYYIYANGDAAGEIYMFTSNISD